MWASLQRRRQLCRQTLSFATLKLLYARLTLTRFTTLYFIFAIISCTVLSTHQVLTLKENGAAVSILSSFVSEDTAHGSLVLLENGVLGVCDGLPNEPGTNCTEIMTFGQNNLTSRSLWDDTSIWPATPYVGDRAKDDEDPSFDISLNETLSAGGACLLSLKWLDGIFRDARREDIVTLVFQIWLLSLAIITLLNESIPHLVAGLSGHVLGTIWSCYRVSSMQSLRTIYQNQIVPEACGNHDLLGNWWDNRIQHAITSVIVNFLTLFCLSYFSIILFQVYANQSFSRVGASPRVHGMYRLVLCFSVCLQMTGFFSLAATALWVNKVCYSMHHFTRHSNWFMATSIVMFALGFPWISLGWSSVRRESKIRYAAFAVISVFLLTPSTFLFFMPLYRYVFISWPFFAASTVTGYVFSIVSCIKGVLCRLNFGKGLAHYLQVMHALAGVDFTPVPFSKGNDVEETGDLFISELKAPALNTHRAFAIQIPALTYSQNLDSKASQNNANTYAPAKRNQGGSSIYFEPNGMPILLSSSPPLVSEFGPVPERFSRVSYSQSRGQRTPSTDIPALPVLKSETQPPLKNASKPVDAVCDFMVSGPPGLEPPEAAAPSSSNSKSSWSSSRAPRLPSLPVFSTCSGSCPSECPTSVSSKSTTESAVEINLKEKKLQKHWGMVGLPPTPRLKSRKEFEIGGIRRVE